MSNIEDDDALHTTTDEEALAHMKKLHQWAGYDRLALRTELEFEYHKLIASLFSR